MADFFISYAQVDMQWAEWIDWHLRDAGYSTLVQVYDFEPGCHFAAEMDRATREASRTLAVLSPDYLTSEYTPAEWLAAFVRDPRGKRRALVPVRVRPCELDGLLSNIAHIDLVGVATSKAPDTLLLGLKAKPRPKAAPPIPFSATESEQEDAAPRLPGTLPPIWNVPFLRNPHFTGRRHLLQRLRETLQPGHPAALIQTLQGLGGVGKTQTAVEFAYRHAADYELVWWIASEDIATLSRDLAALAMHLNLVGQNHQDQDAAVVLLRRWLEGQQGWLIIFDNVDAPSLIEDLLPRGGSGHVLITSRRTDWNSKIDSLDVEAFSRHESIDFLRNRDLNDEQLANQLADQLGDLPLALEQAAAYIAQTDLTLSQYLDLFKKRKRDLLARGVPKDHPEAVTTTWEISFNALESEDPAAAALLQLCAFLAPDDIPLRLLSEGAEHLPPPLGDAAADPIQLNDAIVGAQRYSLLAKAGDALSIHRLVQAILRHQLPNEGRKSWSATAVAVVNSLYRYETRELETWALATRLLTHCQSCLGHLEDDEASQAAAQLLNRSGLYLLHRGLLAEARSNLEKALSIDEFLSQEDQPATATLANNLGQILREQGDLDGALKWTRRALEIDQIALGDKHPNIAIRSNNIGTILKAKGDLEGALEWTHRALEIEESLLGNKHSNLAIHANNIGAILKELGDLDGALEWTRKALEIDRNAFDGDHPNVAIRSNNIGQILKEQGDFASAQTHIQRALRILEDAIGSDHPSTIKVRKNLADLKAGPDPQMSGT